MSKSLIKEFYRTIHLDDLTIAYSGNFTESMTEKIIELSEAYLDSNSKMSKLKKRTSFLVAECFQNVVRHSPKDLHDSANYPLNESFFLRFYDNKCFIASENSVPENQVEGLRSKLELVNKYNKDELREFYRKILDEGELSDEGGAGLGLIEMARKTGNKLHYSFDPGEGGFSMFYLMLVLENSDVDVQPANYTFELNEIKRIIRNVQTDNMFLLYKGSFDTDIIEHVEEILESNLDSQRESLARKIKLYHAAIMTMYNINHYCNCEELMNSGMLFMGKTDEGYSINATFPVCCNDKDEINGILEELKHSDMKELEKLQQEGLKAGASEGGFSSRTTFVQLALLSKAWGYEFDSPPDLPQEFVYQVHI